ncbi:cryptochrome/photolyase family protein [[Mycoplasma] gypis]|uniref:Deoxyribodipyrimidine photo-lyase n=1 Tax=[Mycoplasma] gypis TaxID=92404 RepID=A0ABZ2RQC8_9BACT|nr:deoxyribodipyrimidine photo-lyase [[Mycoplasma] gypis]MBN0919293.1 deoxyribodipyrimidine photo-lyase [[Mycoplasma] gypis]
MKTNIFWLRNDFRFRDNTALIKSLIDTQAENNNLLIVFNFDDALINFSTHSTNYFLSALKVFDNEVISKLNTQIYFSHLNPVECFKTLINKFQINKVYCNATERGYGLFRDLRVNDFLTENNIKFVRLIDKHLTKVTQIKSNSDTNYVVFSPYFKKWSQESKREPLETDVIEFKSLFLKNDFINETQIIKNHFFNKIDKDFSQECGQKLAYDRLNYFIKNNLHNYHLKRDLISEKTSELSPFLATGQLSIRDVFWSIKRSDVPNLDKEKFFQELCWRDFYNMIHYYHPDQHKLEINKMFQEIPWNKDYEIFQKWIDGKTGFPLIDAAMHELQETGRLHNRLRMIVASFLVKDLGIDWRMGEQYFRKTLIDYDSSSNIGSWQWSTSVGTDACPYFRVFNPHLQSLKLDPEAIYIKKWLPCLEKLDKKVIHDIYNKNKKYKINTNDFALEKDYCELIVDHTKQKEKIINLFKSYIKK